MRVLPLVEERAAFDPPHLPAYEGVVRVERIAVDVATGQVVRIPKFESAMASHVNSDLDSFDRDVFSLSQQCSYGGMPRRRLSFSSCGMKTLCYEASCRGCYGTSRRTASGSLPCPR
ncbi:hypothetical protein [Streptomyces sp. NPDC005970]|uniref:hypothetical protein n=1 Tax=Streptomyces sp. NPDC005970 TaxID=3156723 RepID=UPI0033C2191B